MQENVVINKQDLVKNKLFHLNEPFQLMKSRYNGNPDKADFSAAYAAVLLYFRSILVL